MRLLLASFLAVTFVACGDDEGGNQDAATDAEPDAPTDAGTDGPFVAPTMLSETGLYSNIGTKTIAAGVVEFEPRWHLWSDAAVKRRWIYLPPGSKIDTTDMDYWSFPTGTKVWKEFSRGGARIETRLLQKTGTADDVSSWFMVAFQWDAGETDATAVPGGVVDDVGVNDIPDRAKCRQCHGPNRNKAIILGLQALQMDYDAPSNGLDLDRLVTEGTLTVSPAGSGDGYFPMPEVGGGDPTLPALGYLHANCGGCHNQFSDVKNTVDVELRLTTSASERVSWASTRVWGFTLGATGTGVPAQLTGSGTHIVHPMDVAGSAVHVRMSTTGQATRMPPVARETVDTAGLAAVEAWINSLPP